MRKTLFLISLLLFVGIATMAAGTPEFNNNQVEVYCYDAGDDITILKNNFVWIYDTTGYVDADSGTNGNDIFAGIAVQSANYTALQSAYKVRCWIFAKYQPAAGLFNADAANLLGTAGDKVYWDVGTYTETSGVQTLALTLDSDSGANLPIGIIERVVTAASKLYQIKFMSTYLTNYPRGSSETDISCQTIDIAPITNADALDITTTNTNITNAAAIDINWGNVNYVGAAGGAMIDVDCITATTLTGDLSILKIEGGTNVTFNTNTVDYYGIEVDLDAVTDTDFATFYGIYASMPAAYQGTDPTSAVYASGHGMVSTLCYGTNAYYGYMGTANITNANNPLIGMNVSKATNLTIAVAADATITNYAGRFSLTNSNVDDDGWDILCAANAFEIDYTTVNTATTVGTADTLTGNALDLTVTASVQDDANSVIATASAGGIFIDYNLTDGGAGSITTASFNVISIDYDTTAAINYATGNYHFYDVVAVDAAVPSWAANSSMVGYHADLTSIDVSDADLDLYGMVITMPAVYGASSEFAAIFSGDGMIVSIIEDNIGQEIDTDTTDADNGYFGLAITKDLVIDTAAAGNADLTNNALFVESVLDNTNDDVAGYLITSANDIIVFELDHDMDTTAAATDAISATVLQINVLSTTAAATDTVDFTGRGLDINYVMTQTLGVLNLNATDIARIDFDVDAGTAIATGGAGNLNMILFDGDGFLPGATVAAATNITGAMIDWSDVSINDAQASLYGAYIILPNSVENTTNADNAGIYILGTTAADIDSENDAIIIVANGSATGAATTAEGMIIDYDATYTSNGGNFTRQTNPLIDVDIALTETADVCSMTSTIIDIQISDATTTCLLSGDGMIKYATSGTDGLISAAYTMISLTTTFDHDDAAADVMQGIDILWSGDVAGTNATTYLNLCSVDLTGTIGASGANAVVRGYYANLTTTLTNGTYYGVEVDMSTAAAAGTAYGVMVTMPAAYGASTEAAFHATGNTNTVNLLLAQLSIDATGFTRSDYFVQNKYFWQEEFDEEAATVTLMAGLRADEWTAGGTGSADAHTTYVQSPCGALTSIAAATDDNSDWTMGLDTKFNITQNPIFECRFQTDAILTNFVCVGLVEGSFNDKGTYDDDMIVVGMDTDNAHTFGVAQAIIVTNDDAGGAVVQDGGVAISAATWVTVRIDCTDPEQPRVWIDAAGGAIDEGDEVAPGSITGTIQDAIYMMPYFHVQNLAGVVTNEITIDYIKCWSDR